MIEEKLDRIIELLEQLIFINQPSIINDGTANTPYTSPYYTTTTTPGGK